MEIVPDLVGDAQGLAVAFQDLFDLAEAAGVDRSNLQRDREGGRGFFAEDFEHLQTAERGRVASPAEFGALAAAEFALAFGGNLHHRRALFRRDPAGGQEAVSLPDQQVADIQGNWDAVFLVEGFFAVPGGVIVLDVVMDKGSLVEAFDGEGGLAEVVRKRGVRRGAQGLVGGGGEERAPAFSGARKPFVGDAFGLALGGAEGELEVERGEPEIDLIAGLAQVESSGGVLAGEVDVIPDPVQVDRGVNAVVLQKRDGDTGDRGGFHVGKRAFKHAQTADAHDGLDFPRLDQGHDDRGSLRHEDGVSETFRLGLQVLNGAEAALFAQESEFVERRRALVFHPETFWKEQEPALKRHPGQLFPPQLVVQ